MKSLLDTDMLSEVLKSNASDYLHIQEAGYALRIESWR